MARLVGLKRAIVLVAEDDAMVLKVVTRILREGGYDAIAARDGHEAWGFFQRAEHLIGLVITDMVMPHLTGTELAARIVASSPNLPLILMSGFAPGDLTRRGFDLSHGHFLTKPFLYDDLLGLVQQLLPA